MTNTQGRRPQQQPKKQPQPQLPEEESKLKKTLVLFIATFFVTLFFLIFIVQNFSPQVDTEIVETNQEEQTKEEDSGSFQRFVDDRLKWIQQEDNSTGTTSAKSESSDAVQNDSKVANENPFPDANKREEPVRVPKSKFDDVEINETIKQAQQNVEQVQQRNEAPVATAPLPSTPKPVVPFKMTKVYIGNYSTMEQALSTQTRLMDSGLNISPFIKEVNGNYTVQVGSFSSATKAQDLINKLNSQGFYGRTVQE